MNWAFYTSRLRRTFHRLPTLGIPVAFVMVTLCLDIAELLHFHFIPFPRLTPVTDTLIIPLALGLGALGMDTSEGMLPVLLTRPLPRSAYVLGHWAALATAACFWSLMQLLLQWGLIQAFAFHPLHTEELLYNAGDRISLCFGMAAVLVCFSARLPSFGNVLFWGVLYYFVNTVLPGLGPDDPLQVTFVLRRYLEGLIVPMLDFRRTFSATPVSWFRLTTYLSNVSLLLLLAIYILNRREVSYASR